MRFKIEVRNIGEEKTWFEEYDKPCEDAQVMAASIVAHFNDTLRSYEKPRELVDVVVLDKQVGEFDLQAFKLDDAHKTYELWVKNGKKVANEKMYTSHLKGLFLLNYTEDKIEKAALKVAKIAYGNFIDTFDVEASLLKTLVGDTEDAFVEGFVFVYMDNYYNMVEGE